VVTIYDLQHEEEADAYFIITEFAEKGTLAHRLEMISRQLPIDEILHLGMGICSGLEAVHRKAIIHRDVKPSNILLFDLGESRDTPKLSDFGIARALSSTNTEDQPRSGLYGSLSYMSPEQLDEDAEVDSRSDIYSLGVLLYEILTGQLPFTGEPHDIFWGHTYVSPTLPSELRSGIPEALEQIVMRALRKDREHRYQSAADMREALEAIVDIEISKARQHKFKSLVEEGLAALQEEEWERATHLLRQADVVQPEDKRVKAGLRKADEQQKLKRLYERGVGYLEERNWEEARVYFAEVVGHNLRYAEGLAAQHLAKANQELERERSHRDLMVRYYTGMGHYHNQQWELAVTELKEVVAEDPEFKDAADYLKKAQDCLSAEKLLERVQHCKEQGNWEEVVKCLEEVARLNPPGVDVAEDLNQARRDQVRALEEQLLAAWYETGMAYLAGGDLDQAQTSFQKVYERRPDYQNAADRLKEIEERRNGRRIKSPSKINSGLRGRLNARDRWTTEPLFALVLGAIAIVVLLIGIMLLTEAGSFLRPGIPPGTASQVPQPPASVAKIEFSINDTLITDSSRPHLVIDADKIDIQIRAYSIDGIPFLDRDILCTWTLDPPVPIGTSQEADECQISYQVPQGLESQLVEVEVRGKDPSKTAGTSTNFIKLILQSHERASDE
jgi:tetratricopeptide (TPR) repeat protein